MENNSLMLLQLVLWFGISLLIGLWAQKRGRSFGLWAGLALIISPLLSGLILICLKNLKYLAGKKACPRCAELVKQDALVCRFCGYEFQAQQGLHETQSKELPQSNVH